MLSIPFIILGLDIIYDDFSWTSDRTGTATPPFVFHEHEIFAHCIFLSLENKTQEFTFTLRSISWQFSSPKNPIAWLDWTLVIWPATASTLEGTCNLLPQPDNSDRLAMASLHVESLKSWRVIWAVAVATIAKKAMSFIFLVLMLAVIAVLNSAEEK